MVYLTGIYKVTVKEHRTDCDICRKAWTYVKFVKQSVEDTSSFAQREVTSKNLLAPSTHASNASLRPFVVSD